MRKVMSKFYSNNSCWEKLTFSKLRLPKFKIFVSWSVFGKLQFTQLIGFLKKLQVCGKKPCEAFFYLCFYLTKVKSFLVKGFYLNFVKKIKCESLKVVSATFLLVCFLNLKESTCETRKKKFISLQKLFSFSRKSNFTILDFQISWRHQMLKHRIRNTFYWITWEVNTVC